jgi:hypothetical protein
MTMQKIDTDSIDFHRIMAKICISLSFLNLASKSRQLLITSAECEIEKPNRIQREFDSNGAIWTFDHAPSAQENKLSQTFLCSQGFDLCF